MFKQFILYRISAGWEPNAHLFLDSLERESFQPCGATQALSAGWVPPRGEEGAPLLEQIDGHWLLSLRLEKRILPACVIADALEERLEKIEAETGRRPGKKQAKDVKEEVTLELLPRAFTSQSHMPVWIAPKQRLLMVVAGTIGKADEVISLLIKADPSLNLHLLQSAESPAACMGAWLMDGVPPEGFVIDRDCELKAADEMKSVVRYGRHNLDTDELKAHLVAGKMPTRLAMTWKERISFTLTDTLQVKGIKFLDVVFDGRDKPAKDEAFDVDMALATGELSQLIPELIEALGGELDFIGQSKKVAAEHAPAAPLVAPAAPAPHLEGDGADPLYDKAVEVVLANKRASISLVQRHLQIGYNRAARLLEAMEKAKRVTPMSADGQRDILVTSPPPEGRNHPLEEEAAE